MNTKHFGGLQIQQDNHLMEKYAKKASCLFIPFRKTSDLTKEGKYLPMFRDFVKRGNLKEEYCNILTNIQQTYNSLEARRSLDPLERVTKTPSPFLFDQYSKIDDDDKICEGLEEFYESLITNADVMVKPEEFPI